MICYSSARNRNKLMIPTTICMILQKQRAKEIKPVTNDLILQDSIEMKFVNKTPP